MNTIYARADDGCETHEKDLSPVLSLQDAIDAAGPGTRIKLLPGRYFNKVKIENRHGRDGAPIVIEGDGQETVLDGLIDPIKGQQKVTSVLCDITKADCRTLVRFRGNKRPFFRVVDSSWIEWRNLFIENCWPFVFNVSSCHHLTIAGCDVIGARHAFYLKDHGSPRPSHHILIENNHWCQDPTGPRDPRIAEPDGRESWLDWTWHELKRGKGRFDRRFMNGAFLGGVGMAGSLVVRRNTFRFAFNAVRLEAGSPEHREPLREKDNNINPPLSPDEDFFHYQAPDLTRNTNVEIYENTIEHIRDNAIEPEFGAVNWWVWNNRLKNVHKAMSIHNNGGGFWYFFGNVGSTEQVPPAQIEEARRPDSGVEQPRKLGGKMFKFGFGPPLPTRPAFAFHNSWRLRGGIVTGGGEMRMFNHLNNAIEYCARAEDGANFECGSPRFGEPKTDGQEFIYAPATWIKPIGDEASNRFDHDVCNDETFPELQRAQDQEPNGVKARTPIFDPDPDKMKEFLLAEKSPAKGAAGRIKLLARRDWPALEGWSSEAPDSGAMQDDRKFSGPPFAHLENPHYDEAPRLVRAAFDSDALELVFSVPLDSIPIGEDAQRAVVSYEDGEQREVRIAKREGRRLFLVGPDLPDRPIAHLKLPGGLTGGTGANSFPITTWASVVPMSIDIPLV